MSFLDPRGAPRLPGGFEELLQGMAREVLRAQPDDVLGFIARYFQALLAEREQSSAAPRAEDGDGGRTEDEEAEAGPEAERQRGPRDEDLTADFPTSREAATRIQAAFRGFRARRELRRAFSEPPARPWAPRTPRNRDGSAGTRPERAPRPRLETS